MKSVRNKHIFLRYSSNPFIACYLMALSFFDPKKTYDSSLEAEKFKELKCGDSDKIDYFLFIKDAKKYGLKVKNIRNMESGSNEVVEWREQKGITHGELNHKTVLKFLKNGEMVLVSGIGVGKPYVRLVSGFDVDDNFIVTDPGYRHYEVWSSAELDLFSETKIGRWLVVLSKISPHR